jgi:cytoskeletal protein CcmA (bactofilin family)
MLGNADKAPLLQAGQTHPIDRSFKRSGSSTVIGSDLKVVGNLYSDGEIQVEGTVEGDIACVALTVGQYAQIEGSISAETLEILGSVRGKLKATSVELATTAKAACDIDYCVLSIQEGAVVDGFCHRIESGNMNADSDINEI